MKNISESAFSHRKNIWKLRGNLFHNIYPQVLTSCLPLITAICTFFSDPSSSSNTSADHKAQLTWVHSFWPMYSKRPASYEVKRCLFSLKNIMSKKVFLGICFTSVKIINQLKFFNLTHKKRNHTSFFNVFFPLLSFLITISTDWRYFINKKLKNKQYVVTVSL